MLAAGATTTELTRTVSRSPTAADAIAGIVITLINILGGLIKAFDVVVAGFMILSLNRLLIQFIDCFH